MNSSRGWIRVRRWAMHCHNLCQAQNSPSLQCSWVAAAGCKLERIFDVPFRRFECTIVYNSVALLIHNRKSHHIKFKICCEPQWNLHLCWSQVSWVRSSTELVYRLAVIWIQSHDELWCHINGNLEIKTWQAWMQVLWWVVWNFQSTCQNACLSLVSEVLSNEQQGMCTILRTGKMEEGSKISVANCIEKHTFFYERPLP